MLCRIADFRYKEVINVCTGYRLGYVCDVEFDLTDGHITALIVPGPCRFFGIFGREDDYLLPWECIERIGEDIVLVKVPGEFRRCRCEKKRKWM